MSHDFVLTYVVNTRNKLPYLRHTLPRLLDHVGGDEEVVVVDGASTDGTIEYLRGQADRGKIHQLHSAPDQGEAHGWNRGLLHARGELIKVISDDDAFHYPGIRACRRRMLECPEIDVLATEGADAPWTGSGTSTYREDYQTYLKDGRPFSFCGLGLMFRRHALALTGLFNPAWQRIDHEFALRLTQGPALLAWYTGYVWVRITTPDSKTVRHAPAVGEEWHRLNAFYRGQGAPPLWRRAANRISGALQRRRTVTPTAAFDLPRDFSRALDWSVGWLERSSHEEGGELLFRGPGE